MFSEVAALALRAHGLRDARPATKFRVMARSDQKREVYKKHRSDTGWDLLEEDTETQVKFLHSLN